MVVVFYVDLTDKLDFSESLSSHVGVAHTRWATHGEPNWVNAHPQRSDAHSGEWASWCSPSYTIHGGHRVHFLNRSACIQQLFCHKRVLTYGSVYSE